MKKIALGLALLIATTLLAITVILPQQMLQARNQVPEQTPAALGIAFEDTYFQPSDENIKLHGWWMPAPEPKAILLMVHGANGSKEGRFPNSLAMYKDLIERGYTLLAIDLRNHGTSGRGQAGELGMGHSEKQDLVAALDQIDAHNPNKLPVYTLGLSMGGAAVIHLAEIDKRLSGLILFDPMLDTDSALIAGAIAMDAAPAWLVKLVIWGAKLSRELEPSALELAKDQQLPTLLIQDIGDPVTQVEHARNLKELRPDIEYWPVADPEADHWIYEKHGGWGTHVAAYFFEPKTFIDKIDQFISSRI